MFTPMAATVMLALLGAFVLSFTFVPAMAALLAQDARRARRGHAPDARGASARYEPLLRCGRGAAEARSAIGAWRRLLVGLLAFFALGREFIPHARRGRHAGAGGARSLDLAGAERRRCSSGSSATLAGDARGGVRLHAHRHGRDRVRPDAAERLRHVRDAEAARGVARPRPAQGRAGRADRGRRSASCSATTTSSPSRSRCASTS